MIRNALRSVAILASLGTLPVPSAAAQEIVPNYDSARTDRWRCQLCPFEDASYRDANARVGTISVREAQPRFGRDNGLDDDGPHADLQAEYRRRDANGHAVTFLGRDLGLASRDLRFAAGLPGRGGLAVSWRELPRNVATDGRTPYVGKTSLSLPQGWVRAFDTSGMTELANLGRTFDYRTHRRKAAAKAHWQLRPRWRAEADYARETRRGTEETYGDFLYQATGLPKPVDHETVETGGRLRFEDRTFLFAADLRDARFRNHNRSLSWENPYFETPRTGRKGLAVGNDTRTLSLVSRWTGGRTTVRGHLAWGRVRQDDPFLPYTANPSVAVAPLPADSLDARAQTFAGQVHAVNRLTPRLRLGLKHRRRERSNDTRHLVLTPVLGDFFATLPRQSRFHTFDEAESAVRLQYRVARRVKLAAGSVAHRIRRSTLEIDRNQERERWLEVSATNLRGFRLVVRVANAGRDASTFRDITANNPRMRRFHQAERTRRTWLAELDYSFASTGLSVGLSADRRRDDHPDSELGLERDNDRGWGADFSYAPGPKLKLSAFHAVRRSGATTAGSLAFAEPDWAYRTRNAVDASGATLDLAGLARAKLDLSITYAHSEGLARYDTELGAVRSDFPVLVSEMRSLDVRARYRWSANVTLSARYYREDYRAADWALDGIRQAAAPRVISFGRAAPNYGNALFGLSVETRL